MPDPLLEEAVRVLTRAFREWPSDWAEFVSLATAGAAANVGGVERILSRRPGSWEADFCRQLLAGTVGWSGELLLEHRTEPVVVVFHPEELLYDLGPDYDDARSELDRRHLAAEEADDLEQLAAVEELEERLEQQEEADRIVYGEALAATVRRLATERGLTVPVLVEVAAGWRPYEERHADTERTDVLSLTLHDDAVDATPLPASPGLGQPPRSPLERLEDRPPTG